MKRLVVLQHTKKAGSKMTHDLKWEQEKMFGRFNTVKSTPEGDKMKIRESEKKRLKKRESPEKERIDTL